MDGLTMFPLNLPENAWLLGFILIGLTGLGIVVDGVQGKPFWRRFHLHHRRTSSSATPPRTISPDNKSPANAASKTNHVDVLPPQRRHVLANMQIEGVSYREVGEKEVREQILPMTTDYRACEDEKYTPTGFSMREIKALGNFPDYAELSGVPLPQPYSEFDIEKALPRPYRPFRWAYHQTMCMLPLFPSRSTDVIVDRKDER